MRLRRNAALDVIPADLDVAAWAEQNNAVAFRVVDDAIIAVHPQVYNWHLTITSEHPQFVDDDY